MVQAHVSCGEGGHLPQTAWAQSASEALDPGARHQDVPLPLGICNASQLVERTGILNPAKYPHARGGQRVPIALYVGQTRIQIKSKERKGCFSLKRLTLLEFHFTSNN